MFFSAILQLITFIMDKYNSDIAKIGAMFNALSSEILGDDSLQLGEKYLLLQRMMKEITLVEKKFKAIESKIKEFALENLADTNGGKSDIVPFEGAQVYVKYSYVKPSIDSKLVVDELKRAYADMNIEYKEDNFLKEGSVRRSVVVESILDNK